MLEASPIAYPKLAKAWLNRRRRTYVRDQNVDKDVGTTRRIRANRYPLRVGLLTRRRQVEMRKRNTVVIRNGNDVAKTNERRTFVAIDRDLNRTRARKVAEVMAKDNRRI